MPITGSVDKNTRCVGTKEYYSATKRNKILTFTAERMDTEITVLSDIGQEQKDRYRDSSLRRGLGNYRLQCDSERALSPHPPHSICRLGGLAGLSSCLVGVSLWAWAQHRARQGRASWSGGVRAEVSCASLCVSVGS